MIDASRICECCHQKIVSNTGDAGKVDSVFAERAYRFTIRHKTAARTWGFLSLMYNQYQALAFRYRTTPISAFDASVTIYDLAEWVKISRGEIPE